MPQQTLPQPIAERFPGNAAKYPFTDLYVNYKQAVFTVIIKMVKQKEVAEDLMQDVFIKIWRHINTYNGDKGAMFTWMANIARNVCIDHLRSKHHRMGCYVHEDEFNNNFTISLLPHNNVGSQELHKVTSGLNVKVREVIKLVYFMEYTQEEAARTLNIPIGTLKTRNRTGLKKLKQFYADESHTVERLCAVH